jgi:hypothetical protein
MKAYRKTEVRLHSFLFFVTRWRYVVKFSSHPLYAREMILVSTEQGG